MVSTGALLWISVRPLLKMVLCTGAGFLLSKYDLFSPVAARGAGQVLLNVTMPSLMFSKMVPAFTPQNIASLGPLVTIGAMYHIIGFIIAFIVREMFWVPHRFRTGLLAAGIWGNYGDIPTAVIMSITAGAPFSPDDVNLGVAYVAAFILVFFVTLFPLGGHLLIAKDFEGPNKEDEEVKEDLKQRHKKIISFMERQLRCLKWSRKTPKVEEDIEKVSAVQEPSLSKDPSEPQYVAKDMVTTTISEITEEGPRSRHHHAPHVSFEPLAQFHHTKQHHATSEGQPGVLVSPSTSTYGGADMMSPTGTIVAPTEKDFNKETTINTRAVKEEENQNQNQNQNEERSTRSSSIRSISVVLRISRFLRTFLTPATIAIVLAFPISLVRPLKGLFVPVDNSPIPNAPDGKPPLYFIYDTTNFLGAASVPLGLVCLGAALAKLKVPNNLRQLPLGAISGLAIGKLIVSPVLGVLIVNSFVKIGFIREDDKVLRFVTIFFSCMPTATTQVFLTQVYSGTGEAEHLGAFLLPQYALMFVSMTALTAYTLHLLF